MSIGPEMQSPSSGWRPVLAKDNIFVERLRQTVKCEEVYLQDYPSPREARQSLARYFAFHNYEWPHQAPGHRIPWESHSGQLGPVPDGGQVQALRPGLTPQPIDLERTSKRPTACIDNGSTSDFSRDAWG